MFHLAARAAGKAEEIAIHVKGCQEAGRGTAREGRSPRDTSSVILLSNCLCCVLERERERARQSKDSLSANKELNGSTLCKNRCTARPQMPSTTHISCKFTKPSFYLRYQPNLELRPILIVIAIQLCPAARLTQPPHAALLRSSLTQLSSYDAHLNEVSSILQ